MAAARTRCKMVFAWVIATANAAAIRAVLFPMPMHALMEPIAASDRKIRLAKAAANALIRIRNQQSVAGTTKKSWRIPAALDHLAVAFKKHLPAPQTRKTQHRQRTQRQRTQRQLLRTGTQRRQTGTQRRQTGTQRRQRLRSQRLRTGTQRRRLRTPRRRQPTRLRSQTDSLPALHQSYVTTLYMTSGSSLLAIFPYESCEQIWYHF